RRDDDEGRGRVQRPRRAPDLPDAGRLHPGRVQQEALRLNAHHRPGRRCSTPARSRYASPYKRLCRFEAFMKRREFIALLSGTVATFPFATSAQQRPRKIPRIGIIDDSALWNPYRDALREAGYIDGRTVAYEYRVAEGRPDRLAAAAAELARLPVDLIATYGTPASRAAKAAT